MTLKDRVVFKPRRRLSRRLVFLLVFLALFQLLASGVPLLINSYQNQRLSIQEAQVQATKRIAQSLDSYILSAMGRLEAFIDDHDKGVILHGRTDPETVRWMWDLLNWGGFLEVWILDAQGDVILQSSYRRFVNPEQYVNRADRPEYTTLQEGQPYYIGPIRVPDDPALSMLPVSTVAVPIVINQEIRGVLVAELDTRKVQEIISALALESGSYAYVVDQDGILRVHWSDMRVALEERTLAAIPVVQAFLEGQENVPNYQGISEEVEGQVLGTWSAMTTTDWGVIVERPVAEAFRGLLRMTFALVALLVVSVVVAGGIGALVARSLLRPLGVLQEGAHQLGSGNLTHRIDLDTQDEFAVLAGTFNQMAERVQSSHESIEAEVQARTQELSETYEQLRRQSEQQGQLLETIRRMSVPVIPVLEGVVVMPLVGNIDTERADMVTEALLSGIEEHRAQVVILDITGLPVVDTSVANALLKSMQAANLLGVWSILVGITPEVAQTVVYLGVDLSQINTRSTLQAGVEYAMSLLKRGAPHRVR